MRIICKCQLCKRRYYVNYGYRPEGGYARHRHKSCCPTCLPRLRVELANIEKQAEKRVNQGALISLGAGRYRNTIRRGIT